MLWMWWSIGNCPACRLLNPTVKLLDAYCAHFEASGCVWGLMSMHLTYNIDHFRDESFQAVDSAGTDNQSTTKRKYTKYTK